MNKRLLSTNLRENLLLVFLLVVLVAFIQSNMFCAYKIACPGVFLLTLLTVIVNGTYFSGNALDKAKRICSMKDCVQHRVSDYSFIDFYEIKHFNFAHPLGYLIKLELFVQGKENFHILLSETNTPFEPSDQSYEFVIGDKSNTHTYIRRQKGVLKMSENITPLILDVDVPVKVDLEITNGGQMKLSVENQAVTEAIDTNPIAIKYISFASSKNNTVEVFYNCPNYSGSKLDNDFILKNAAQSIHSLVALVFMLLLAVLLPSFNRSP